MNPGLKALLERNQKWSAEIKESNPEFFEALASQQNPDFLWIGCSDSRVPANQISGMWPGEVFVHRNVANQVNHTDLNAHSVMQYAIDALQVTDVIVCGHYGCGGVAASLKPQQHGIVDWWIRGVRDTYHHNQAELDALSEEERLNRLCELNVKVQVANVCHSNTVMNAWQRGQELRVHGLIYGLHDGLLKDLGVTASCLDDIPKGYQTSM